MTDTPDPRPTPERDADAPGWDDDAALDLLIAHTGPGQTVLDLDADPGLRAAAEVCGRRYRTAVPPWPDTGQYVTGGTNGRADLVTMAWSRPGRADPVSGSEALVSAAAQLASGGHVAVLLEPTIVQPSTITWVGALLSAARDAGLDYLQDIVCLHTSPVATAPDGDIARPRDEHRVLLILRTRAGRHA